MSLNSYLVSTSNPAIFNVRAFGAIGDGLADDSIAVRAALAAMTPVSTLSVPGNRWRLYFPPGTYRFATAVHVDRRCAIEGAVAGGVTIVTDDWQSAFVFHGNTNSGNGGDSATSRILNIAFQGGPDPTSAPKWAPGAAYAISLPHRVLPANLGMSPTDAPYSWEYHYECIKSGTSASASMSPSNIANSTSWAASTAYNVGDVVKMVSANGTTPGRADVVFACTGVSGDQKSGTGQPAAFGSAVVGGGTIPDHNVTWTPMSTGEPVWTSFQNPDESVEWAAAMLVGYGTVVRPPASMNRYDVYFIATTPGIASPQQTTEATAPAAFATCVFGDKICEGGIVWRAYATGAEPPPPGRINNQPYTKGEKIKSPSGTLYVCQSAGTSGGSAPSQFASAQDPRFVVTDGTVTWKSYNAGASMILDGTVVWSCRVASGIRLLAAIYAEQVFFTQYPNAGFHVQADSMSYQDTGVGVIPPANANFWSLRDSWITQCGCGVYVRGGDSNAGLGMNLLISGHASFPPYYPAEIGIADRSFLGCRWILPGVQAVGGPGFAGPSNSSTGSIFGGYFEACGDLDIPSTSYTTFGGTVATSVPVYGLGRSAGFTARSNPTGVLPGPRNSSHLVERDGLTLTPGLEFGLGNSMVNLNNNLGYYATVYGRREAGWLGWEYYSNVLATCLMWSTSVATEGTALLQFPRGYYVGLPGADRYYTFGSVLDSKAGNIESGLRTVGYRRVLGASATLGGFLEQVVTATGCDGVTWTLGTSYAGDITSGPYRRYGDTVIPTNTSNHNCFRCTLAGAASTAEPSWASAPSLGSTFIDSDGTHWLNVGTQPVWSNCNSIQDPSTFTLPQPHVRRVGSTGPAEDVKWVSVTTTDATTMVLDTYALPGNTTTDVEVTVTAFQSTGTNAPDGASFRLSSVYYRSGGAPVVVQAPSVDRSNPNANGAAWSAVLVLNGNFLEIRVTGDTSKTIRWSGRRRGLE